MGNGRINKRPPVLQSQNRSHKQVLDARRLLRRSRLTVAEIQEKARQYGIDALKALREVIEKPTASDLAKISAAQTLLDRGYGRPTQTNLNTTVNTDGSPPEITDKELNRRIEETLRATEALTRVAGPPKRKREKIESEEGPADIRKLH